MTDMNVEINDQASAKLAEIRARLQNPEPLMAGIAAEVLSLSASHAYEKKARKSSYENEMMRYRHG